jgi:hypothetical protein
MTFNASSALVAVSTRYPRISKLFGDQTKHARIVFDHQDGLSLLRRADRQSAARHHSLRACARKGKFHYRPTTLRPLAATTSLALGFTAG